MFHVHIHVEIASGALSFVSNAYKGHASVRVALRAPKEINLRSTSLFDVMGRHHTANAVFCVCPPSIVRNSFWHLNNELNE